MNAMMRRAARLQSEVESGGFDAAFGSMPAGSANYSQISVWSGDAFCSHTFRMMKLAERGKPEVVSNVSGNCGQAGARNQASDGPVQTGAETKPNSLSSSHI